MARRKGIALDGVLLLDKPAGWSSNQALGRVKHVFGARKAGHTGTLDPFATGLLPVCFGEATKFSSDLLEADKTYEATAELGVRTRTGDVEGEVLERRGVDCGRDQVERVLQGLVGEIEQIPPMHSALKRDGKPLYALARAGIEVERAPRRVVIGALELLRWERPLLSFRVRCSKGTYVRTLAEQIGDALGCGAHLQALRRTGIGRFGIGEAVALDALEGSTPEARGACLKPVDALVAELPAVTLDAGLAIRFLQGQRLPMPAPAPRCRVYGPGKQFLGTARFDGHVLAPERLIAPPAKHSEQDSS